MTQADLFDCGERLSPAEVHRRENARGAAAPIGSGPEGETCKSCMHYRRVQHHDYVYRKCALMQHAWSHGGGTDIKASWPACREWDTYTPPGFPPLKTADDCRVAADYWEDRGEPAKAEACRRAAGKLEGGK